jgi:hypothetical protein
VDLELDADLLACARCKLLKNTAVNGPQLEELGSWAAQPRSARMVGHSPLFRVDSNAKYALVKGANATNVAWFKVEDLMRRRRLRFDCSEILLAAVSSVSAKGVVTTLTTKEAGLVEQPSQLWIGTNAVSGGADEISDHPKGSSCIHTKTGLVPCSSTSSWASALV